MNNEIKTIISRDPNYMDKREISEWKRCNLLDFFATVVTNSDIVYKALKENGVQCNFELPTKCEILQDNNTKSIIFDMIDKNGRIDKARIIPAVARVPRGSTIAVYEKINSED